MTNDRSAGAAAIIAATVLLLAVMLASTSCALQDTGRDVAEGSVSYDEVKLPEGELTREPQTGAADDSSLAVLTDDPTDTPEETSYPVTEPQTEPETTPPVTTETTEPETTEPPFVHVTGISLTFYEVTLQIGESDMPIVTMAPDDADDLREIWESSDESVATVDVYGNITAVSAGHCTVRVTSYDNGSVFADVSVTVEAPPETTTVPTESEAPTESVPAENASPSTGALTYIGGILVVNKTYPLPEDYNPGVDSTAYAALCEMFNAAAAEGLSLWVKSGFRSYNDQKWQYNYYAEQDGAELADTYSARPGHSEHQSGLAFDLNSLYKSFADTPEGQWLAANCHKYGFIIRYPAGKEHLTGYMYEPWHVRYLGVDNATAVYESGLCLEEYLGITSQYSY